MEIGQKIKKVRELRNFTQEYVATQLGMTQEGYSKIETDRTKVSLERVEQIAKILQIDFLDLMSFDEKIVFNNVFNNQRDNIRNVVIGNQKDTTKELYERLIEELKKQIDQFRQENQFLRELLKDKK